MPVEPLRVVWSPTFQKWFDDLEDDAVFGAVTKRLQRLALGNAGDAAPVGEGVSELRVHLGAGWRVYYVRRGDAYVLLYGGSKRTQADDIEEAKRLARDH